MDKESLDLGNDSVLNDPDLGRCEHGKRRDLCELADCREIWQLFQESLQERQRDERDWRDAAIVEKRRGNKSEYEGRAGAKRG